MNRYSAHQPRVGTAKRKVGGRAREKTSTSSRGTQGMQGLRPCSTVTPSHFKMAVCCSEWGPGCTSGPQSPTRRRALSPRPRRTLTSNSPTTRVFVPGDTKRIGAVMVGARGQSRMHSCQRIDLICFFCGSSDVNIDSLPSWRQGHRRQNYPGDGGQTRRAAAIRGWNAGDSSRPMAPALGQGWIGLSQKPVKL